MLLVSGAMEGVLVCTPARRPLQSLRQDTLHQEKQERQTTLLTPLVRATALVFPGGATPRCKPVRQCDMVSQSSVPTKVPERNNSARETRVAPVGGQQDGGHEGCVPGFQVKHYQVAFSGAFQKGQPLVQVEFDDCAANEDVTFEVSDPSFQVDGDLNLVPHEDVLYSGPVLFIHGVSAHADDLAEVEISGLPNNSPHKLRSILGLGQTLPSRHKRTLLVPPMIVTENQRAPFPRFIGKRSCFAWRGSLEARLFGCNQHHLPHKLDLLLCVSEPSPISIHFTSGG
ncbi:unnamed protein product [Pleuronectes platessa]|uniref:Cadherin prodomain domain-containing protein n=1 Tax=Pleuronectes platessa TaxID=8262 RepID=A0A9N7Y9Z5_PLEPL|nr:unnamed protein product [Pleuronectes platessa]